MTDAERTRQYREFAMLCEDKKRRKCRADCSRCPLNISLYPDLAAGDAVAIQTKAAIDYYEKRSTVIANAIVKVLVWAFWIGVALWCWTSFRSCTKPPQQATPDDGLYNVVESVKGETIKGKDAEQVIQFTRKVVADVVVDINLDRKINCIDYSAFFCCALENTKMVINQRAPMNHMFNAVKLDSGKVVFIEPAPTVNNEYLMSVVWAGKDKYSRPLYTRFYNNDYTVFYLLGAGLISVFEEDDPIYSEVYETVNNRVDTIIDWQPR